MTNDIPGLIERLRASDWGMGLGREAAAALASLQGALTALYEVEAQHQAEIARHMTDIIHLNEQLRLANIDAANNEAEAHSLSERVAEAVECCTIKDNRNLRLEAERDTARADADALRAQVAALKDEVHRASVLGYQQARDDAAREGT